MITGRLLPLQDRSITNNFAISCIQLPVSARDDTATMRVALTRDIGL